ncbi:MULTISPECIES: methionyl-tRNA formyltransferase [Brevibacillus]|uniref:Methionyl-tRNA formyltransferase n=1 Tax=Brevibacillus laterosporus TaxID=1465 RepID=A0AAP3G6G7_BRELA|nr:MULTISPECIES: methionyl-tRNA formyltransferase [Brevibacillus]ATO48067.1 methionyl-tRNA formyltransferase [Brevibacillus laterosporus DSM 25]AYB37162.1 methionyl-tRNA formyltransferase [Brevibacillus laterosporus]MBG9799810.1 methionyl-tRNA formyltransferase [Brevibacillus laterosporus]MBG9801731.1 methionyl-tRNA formyltransferase [Brevibacillus laterosporus]MCR8937830.1 methionyl-tRNA formyltransferase [Brevibacillus laterosporus]
MKDTRILFMGTPDFSTQSLQALITNGYQVVGVVTQPDRPVGRKRVLTPPPVKELALRYGLPVYQPEKIRESEAVQSVLDATRPDLIVTAAYGQILPTSLLEAPKHGCINIHASLLPKYRGGAPIHASIINGEKETGVTIMYMVQALDAGDMISKVIVPIEERDTAASMFEKLATAGADLLIDTLPKLLNGEITPEPQNHEEATFAPNIKRENERLDWNKSAQEIYNQVRGMNSWPVAFTTFEEKVWKIWWAEVVELAGQLATPGTIIDRTEDGLIIACGAGSIILKEIQPEGKKRMSVYDFLRGAGASIALGSKVGE